MRSKRLLVNLAVAAVTLVLAFAIPELILRVVRPEVAHNLFASGAGDQLTGLQDILAVTERYSREHGIARVESFLDTSDIMWSLKRDYDETIPRLPWVEGEKRTWRVVTNSRGFRGREFSERKPPGTFRIVCLGDSIIFGDKVDQGETIPEVLERLLSEDFTGRRVEVINAGVPGSSSRQGLADWRSRIHNLDADVLVIAYGFNDQWPSAVPDEAHFPPDWPVVGDALSWLRRTETYRTLRGVILALRRRASEGATQPAPVGVRVPLLRMKENVRAMVREASAAGARSVVVHTAPGKDEVRNALREVVEEESVSFVDAAGAVRAAQGARSRAITRRHGLSGKCTDASDRDPGVLFRVVFPEVIAQKGEVFVRAFGYGGSRELPLADDGRGCDERAGDGVWTGLLEAVPNATVQYIYVQRGADGLEMDELNAFPWTWRTRIAGTQALIDVYNRFHFMSEDTHPDAEGAEVMARAIAAAIRSWAAPDSSQDAPRTRGAS